MVYPALRNGSTPSSPFRQCSLANALARLFVTASCLISLVCVTLLVFFMQVSMIMQLACERVQIGHGGFMCLDACTCQGP